MTYPVVKKLPPGYKKVAVILTEQEYARWRGAGALQKHGTISEAVRARLGMRPSPHKFLQALQTQLDHERAEDRASHAGHKHLPNGHCLDGSGRTDPSHKEQA